MHSIEAGLQKVLDRGELLKALRAFGGGDFSVRMPSGLSGVDGEIAKAFNDAVGVSAGLASELERVGDAGSASEGAPRVCVPGAAGGWARCAASVNALIDEAAYPVTEAARVIGSVAMGELSRGMVLEAGGRPLRGDALRLGMAVNAMASQLKDFASEVSRVVREVGTEGKLGGQAQVPGVAGVWKQLTDNVNQLAANLTTQVRAISEVARAVTKGDLTRSVMVDARGEVGSLKVNINDMIRNLRDTTLRNTEQDWLKTHLARFTRMLQGHRDLVTVSRLILSELTPLVNAQQAAFYVADTRGGGEQLELLASYAHRHAKSLPRRIEFGEGLVGQCALDKKRVLLAGAPADYIRIGSALGSAPPASIIILPVLFEGQVKAVIELASFGEFSEIHQSFLDQLTESIGVVLHTIAANMQTEYLLHQSQLLTAELQAQQEEMKKTNDRLEQQALNLQQSESMLKTNQDQLSLANAQLQEKARQLSEQMGEVEFKNREIDQARVALEDKAEQLALSSRYKSEFLANMSHELRTPLNSLLILARLLADNAAGNLAPKQVEFAKTIYASGAELLSLINDILDLAKIESGTVTLNLEREEFSALGRHVERTFGQVAADKGLDFSVWLDPALPAAVETDAKRLQQILTNLLSNAFKFTAKGGVSLRIEPAASGWSPGHPVLDAAHAVVAFSVADTGVGIPIDKQRLIFEAFQQADGTTSREYGGTGLGLSISRELTRLLGGEIRLSSVPGRGSTFVLYLPAHFYGAPAAPATESTAQGAPRAEAPARALAQAAGALAGKKVLVVDDDIRNVFALASVLEMHGMTVLHADSGKEGIEALKGARDIDAVLMDVMMPGLDGYDTMRLVRQLAGYRSVPIVAVTAKAMLGDREKCIEAGASDYVAKPVDIEDLLATLSRSMLPEGGARLA
jgi:signal transduction histidine kinase/CheY-like chemotaxis protein